MSRLQQIKQIFVAGIHHKALESVEPDFNSLLNREIVTDSSNDDFSAVVKSNIREFSALSQENNVLSDERLRISDLLSGVDQEY